MGMLALVRKVLVKIGIKEERFSLQWASAAEAPRFVRLITDFTQQIKELGPLGEAEGIEPDELKKRLALGLAAVSDRKLRMSFGTATRTIRKEADITQKYIDSVIEDKLTKPFKNVFEPKVETEKKPAAAKKPVTPKKSAVAKKATPSKKKTSAAKKKTATKKKK
jgi:hypothetical protein